MLFESDKVKNAFSNFKSLKKGDEVALTCYSPLTKFISCEYNFANLAVWGDIYDITWTVMSGVPVIHIGKDDMLLFPHIPQLTADDLLEFSRVLTGCGSSGLITQVPPQFLNDNPEVYEFFEVAEDADFADYIYEVKALATLPGSALSKKRNLIAQFRRMYGEPISEDLDHCMIDDCLKLAELAMGKQASKSKKEELIALRKAFANFSELDLSGVAVSADGKLIGFSVFSRHLDGSYCVHFEKTLPEVKGAAQVVNKETAEALLGKCEFVNREQDLGIPGLRRAKKSYQPAFELLNYNLTPKRGLWLPGKDSNLD